MTIHPSGMTDRHSYEYLLFRLITEVRGSETEFFSFFLYSYEAEKVVKSGRKAVNLGNSTVQFPARSAYRWEINP